MGIKEVIEAVLKAVDSNNERLLIQRHGHFTKAISTVNPPAEESVIAQFERQIGHRLPKDHRSFLLEYNGAHIYQMILEYGINGGGGLKLFSVQEMTETLADMDEMDATVPHFLPIGDVEQQHLAISLEAVEKKDPNYLFLLAHIDGPQALNLDLHLFLDRFVVSQGSPFWEWAITDADDRHCSED